MNPAGLGPENDCAGEDSSNYKRQTRPLAREGAPDGGLIPRQTGRNITHSLTLTQPVLSQFFVSVEDSIAWGESDNWLCAMPIL
jgi:hypothetical protein